MGSLSKRRLEPRKATGKWAIFLFNLPSHYHICIVNYIFTGRDDYFENMGETIAWHAKCSLQSVAQISFLSQNQQVYLAMIYSVHCTRMGLELLYCE